MKTNEIGIETKAFLIQLLKLQTELIRKVKSWKEPQLSKYYLNKIQDLEVTSKH